jgi:hypothetical protein
MNTLPVEFDNIRLVVRSASVSVGLLRTLLTEQARKEEAARGDMADGDTVELSRRILHTMIYPSLIAAVVEHEGIDPWPPTFEQFAEFPEQLEAKWEKAVYELNPHWLPTVEEEPEKKAAPGPKR